MKIRFKYFKVLMILFLPLQICIFHYGAILWRSLSDFEYLSLPVTTKSLSPACGSTDCQLAKRFNYSRCLIFTRDLSSAREQNKTIFFQPHKCFYATFWHKEHEITWLPEFHVRPLICFEYKSLSNPSKHGQLQKKCNALIAHCSAYKTLSEMWFNRSWKIMMHCTQFLAPFVYTHKNW